MTKVYVVTEGEYSDKEIAGVFDDHYLAFKFQVYHAYNELIEEFELNPAAPEFHGLWFYARHDLARTNIHVARASNAIEHDTTLRFDALTYSRALRCEILADSEEHATKVFREKLSAFLAGSTHAYDAKGDAYQMIGGQITKLETQA
jgi:hypothetical protein